MGNEVLGHKNYMKQGGSFFEPSSEKFRNDLSIEQKIKRDNFAQKLVYKSGFISKIDLRENDHVSGKSAPFKIVSEEIMNHTRGSFEFNLGTSVYERPKGTFPMRRPWKALEK